MPVEQWFPEDFSRIFSNLLEDFQIVGPIFWGIFIENSLLFHERNCAKMAYEFLKQLLQYCQMYIKKSLGERPRETIRGVPEGTVVGFIKGLLKNS